MFLEQLYLEIVKLIYTYVLFRIFVVGAFDSCKNKLLKSFEEPFPNLQLDLSLQSIFCMTKKSPWDTFLTCVMWCVSKQTVSTSSLNTAWKANVTLRYLDKKKIFFFSIYELQLSVFGHFCIIDNNGHHSLN